MRTFEEYKVSYIILEVRDKRGCKKEGVSIYLKIDSRSLSEKLEWRTKNNKQFELGYLVLLNTKTMSVIKIDESTFIKEYLRVIDKIKNLWSYFVETWGVMRAFYIVDFFNKESKYFALRNIGFMHEADECFLEIKLYEKEPSVLRKEIFDNKDYLSPMDDTMYFSLSKEKIQSVRSILERLIVEYIDLKELSKLFPIYRAGNSLKQKLLGKSYVYGIKDILVVKGYIRFYLDRGVDITEHLKEIFDHDMKKLCTEEGEYELDASFTKIFRVVKNGCVTDDAYEVEPVIYAKILVCGFKGVLKKHMKNGTIYAMLCNVLDYLEKYPIVIDEIYREDIGDDSNVYIRL